MADFITALKTSEIPVDAPACTEVNGKKIAIFFHDGEYYAIDNECTHKSGPLCEGEKIDGEVECPWHGAHFDITTGDATGMPAIQGVETYEVRVEGEELQVKTM